MEKNRLYVRAICGDSKKWKKFECKLKFQGSKEAFKRKSKKYEENFKTDHGDTDNDCSTDNSSSSDEEIFRPKRKSSGLPQSSSVNSILEIYVKQKTTVVQDEQIGKHLENTNYYEPIYFF